MTDNLRDLEPGTEIGYHPVGAPDARVIGIVKRHYGGDNSVGVEAAMPDDPGIVERVPYDRIEAVEL